MSEIMSGQSFEEMLGESVKTVRNGEVVEGTVIDVKENEIILNIGCKADGIITKNEYSNDQSIDLTEVVHVGDTMSAKVLKVNDGEGQVILTYKRLAAEKGNKRLEEAFKNEEVLKAPVTQVLDGGLCVVWMRRGYSSRPVLCLTHMRGILPSMPIRRSNSSSPSSIPGGEGSSGTGSSSCWQNARRNRKSSWLGSHQGMLWKAL